MTQRLNERVLSTFPAGSNGEFNLPEDLTSVISSGNGCRLEIEDGRKMLDFSMGWGSVLVGHANKSVTSKVAERLLRGTNFATISDVSLELAERIIQISPACEKVRFCASGTEATMYCLRLARAYTGRSKVLRFEGAYHGAHDIGVTSLFPSGDTDFPSPEPSSHGLSDENVLVAPFNNPKEASDIIAAHANEIAAVIVEPLQRCLPPAPGFLETLRQVTAQNDVLLVFDEVVTGFRLAFGGAQEYYGVIPDLVAYGKALGGGFPIGLFGGKASILELASESRQGNDTYVWTASTLGGNPISCTAALATLDVLSQSGVYDKLHQLGSYLRKGMKDLLEEMDISAYVLGDGPLAQIAFTNVQPYDYRSSQHIDKIFARELMLELFRNGIFLNPMGTKLYLSIAHDEVVCDEFLEILRESLANVQSTVGLAV